jgi:anaerobic selenocysteine-containing dehydrogenase
MSEKITACFLCSCNCGLVMTLDDSGKIVKVLGDKNNPRTKGFLCNKGLNLADHIDSPFRLTTPQKREEDTLTETSWENSLGEIGEKLKAIKKKYGPRSIAMVIGGSPHPMLQNVMAYTFLRSLGSRNMYSPISLEFSGRYYSNKKMFGCSYFEGHPDFENANFILLIGTNPLMSHPLYTKDIKKMSKDPDRTLAVLDPRKSDTAKLADIHGQIKPSTDIYFLLAMLNIVISEKLYDKEITEKYASGLDDVAKAVLKFTPEAASEITGIPADVIIRISRGFTSQKPGMIQYDMGVIANHHATLISWAAKTLTLLNGNYGVKGGRLFSPTLINQNQTENFAFMGKKYTSRMRDYPEITGHMPITVLQDEILTPGDGQIRAVIVQGCNPLRTYSNAGKMEKAFKELELLVSIDPFLTEVGRLAHYVLPACSFHEQDNIAFGFPEMYPTRFVQLTQQIREPLGDSRPEWMIYRDLSKKAGVNFMDNTVVDKIFKLGEKINDLKGGKEVYNRQEKIYSLMARMGGTSYKELKEKPHGFDLTDGKFKNMMAEIRTKDKKACLNVPEFLKEVEGLLPAVKHTSDEYPLILSTTCRTLGNLNTMYRNEKWLARHQPDNSLMMHPDDGSRYDVIEEKKVMLISESGAVETDIVFSENAMPGTIYMRGGWGIFSRDPNDNSGEIRGASATMLIPDTEAEAITGMPLLSGVPCRVENIQKQKS